MLLYSERQPDLSERNYNRHQELITEATQAGVFVAAEPLDPAAASSVVRVENGRRLVTDGPFAETKEQLAGYYVLDCRNREEALEWAAKIPPACSSPVAIEVRQMPGIPARAATP
jgi:hypothetical protein